VKLAARCRQWLKQRCLSNTANTRLFDHAKAWQSSPQGKVLLAAEQRYIDDLLNIRFGYHLCYYSLFTGTDVSGNSRINHRIECSDNPQLWQRSGNGLRLAMDGRQIPLESESIDVVVLHHSLEFAQDPHQLLREAERVLIPHGHLIITVFNPHSPWGVYSLFGRFLHSNPIWRRRYMSQGSLNDWLRLLGLNPEPAQPHFYRLPLASDYLLDRTQWLEKLAVKTGGLNWGGSYTIAARKEVSAMTPIKPRWQKTSAREHLIAGTSANLGSSKKVI